MVKFNAGNPWNLICILVTSPVHIRCSSMRAHPSGIGLHPHPSDEIREVHLVIWHSKPSLRPAFWIPWSWSAQLNVAGECCRAQDMSGKNADFRLQFISASLHFYGSNLKKVAPPEPSRDAHLPEHWKLKIQSLRSKVKFLHSLHSLRLKLIEVLLLVTILQEVLTCVPLDLAWTGFKDSRCQAWKE